MLAVLITVGSMLGGGLIYAIAYYNICFYP
jgi:hypothetical protein